jgi:hypothetical protein
MCDSRDHVPMNCSIYTPKVTELQEALTKLQKKNPVD